MQHLTQLEMMKENIKTRLEEYDKEIHGHLRDEGFECCHEMENSFYVDDESDIKVEPEEPSGIPEVDSFNLEGYNEYVGAQIMVPQPDCRIQGRITKRAKDEDGNPIGRRLPNFYLDTHKYEVELSDGTTEE